MRDRLGGNRRAGAPYLQRWRLETGNKRVVQVAADVSLKKFLRQIFVGGSGEDGLNRATDIRRGLE